MPGCARPVGYVPRQTHECDAAVLVRRHLAEFLERCEERVGPLPAFVDRSALTLAPKFLLQIP